MHSGSIDQPSYRIVDMLRNPYFTNKHVLRTLISHHLTLTREEMIAHHDNLIPYDIYQRIYNDYQAYSIDHKPLEYIIGHITFGNRRFHVSPATLIPRPETEEMVQAVVTHLTQNTHDTSSLWHCIDIGTGCGILGISIFLELPQYVSHVTGIDISNDALDVAKHNADRLLPRSRRQSIVYGVSDMLTGLNEVVAQHQHPIPNRICFVANLPYIPTHVFDTNVDRTVKDREPRMAFVGGDDGLDLYHMLCEQLQIYTNTAHCTEWICFAEMMTQQCDYLANKYSHIYNISIAKTFHANIVICIIQPCTTHIS